MGPRLALGESRATGSFGRTAGRYPVARGEALGSVVICKDGSISWARTCARLLAPVLIAVSACGGSTGRDVSILNVTWQVVEVGDIHWTGSPSTLVFHSDDVAISTPCRHAVIGYTVDTDSDAISFSEPGDADRACSSAEYAFDRELVAAIRGATEWRRAANDELEIYGSTQLVLRRLASG